MSLPGTSSSVRAATELPSTLITPDGSIAATYRALALAGAQILAVPANFPELYRARPV